MKKSYWKYLIETYNPNYNQILKFQKLRKYEKIEFEQKYKFSPLDKLLSSLSNLLFELSKLV